MTKGSLALRSTLSAPTAHEQGDAFDLDLQLPLQAGHNGGGERLCKLHHTLAGDAHEMVVIGWLVRIEPFLALLAIKALRADESFLLQPAQGSIDRREIQRSIALVSLAVNLFGRGMAARGLDDLQNQAPLCGDPSTLCVESLRCLFDEIAHPGSLPLLQTICNKSTHF